MIVDDKEKLARQLDMNPGNKTSSLETVGRLDIDGNMAKGAKAREDFNPGPIDGVDLSDLPPLPDDLPPLPDAGAAAPVGKDQRSEEHTSELQSLMRSSYAVFCLPKKTTPIHPLSATRPPY